MQIYIARNGQRLGPYSVEEVNRQLASGAISSNDQAWYEGAAAWAPLTSIPGVILPGATGGAVAAAGGSAMPPTAARNEPLAVWALVAGILGFCCIPASIAAIVLGHMSLSRLGKTPGLGGRGLALTGLVLGYVSLVANIVWLFFMGGMSMLQGMQN